MGAARGRVSGCPGWPGILRQAQDEARPRRGCEGDGLCADHLWIAPEFAEEKKSTLTPILLLLTATLCSNSQNTFARISKNRFEVLYLLRSSAELS